MPTTDRAKRRHKYAVRGDEMRIKIYQINSSRDTNQVKFWGLESLPKFQNSSEVDATLYDNVFDAEMDEMSLEEIFTRFNNEKHPLYRGHSLSVSDVVVTENGAYFCDSFGYKGIEFDESKTQKQDNLIQVLYVEPHKKPYVTEIPNTYEATNQAVMGLIEYIYNDDGTLYVINEESKINGMEGNRRIEGDVLVGQFIVAGDSGEDLRSLTEKEIEKYLKKFDEPEQIPRSEIEQHIYMNVFAWPMGLS